MLIRIFYRSIIIAIFTLLVGCMVGPDYHVPATAVFNKPAAKTLVSASKPSFSNHPVPNKWWKLYNNSTLNKLIEEALVANTDLRVAAANLARANAEVSEARSQFYPSTNLFASYTNFHVSAETLVFNKPIPTLPFVNYLTAGGGVVLPLDFFGKIRRGIEAANADRDAAEAARDLAFITVVAETTSAYTDMCAAGYQVKIANHLLKLQKQTTTLTKRLEEGGRATAFDLSRSNSELEQIRANIPGLEAISRNALYRLAMLTGHTPAEFNHKIKNCNTLPKLTAVIPVGDGATLLRRRPDIREAERKLAASTAKIGVATANLYPDISLGALAGTFGHLQDATNLSTFFSNAGPLITWTFPNTSIVRARIAQAKASAQADFAKFDGVVLTALKEVESNLTTYAYDLDRCQDLKAAHAQSKKAFRQSKLLYRDGREGFLDTLDAEKTLTNVSTSLAVAESKLATDQVNLFLSLGGGWS
jgi:outer membrane protein, multidrug efflux system